MHLDREHLVPRLTNELADRYDGVFPRETVERVVAASWDALEPNARIRDFLPALIEHHAVDQLRAIAHAEGRVAKSLPSLLFLCEHNAGRSQMAAALAEHLSDHRVHVHSAGWSPRSGLNTVAVDALKERGIELTTAYRKPITDSVVSAADVVVTIGDGHGAPSFPGARHETWDVADPEGQPIEVVREIRDGLEARVTALLHEVLGEPVLTHERG